MGSEINAGLLGKVLFDFRPEGRKVAVMGPSVEERCPGRGNHQRENSAEASGLVINEERPECSLFRCCAQQFIIQNVEHPDQLKGRNEYHKINEK